MRRIKLVVAYDGTDFSGWAAQNGRRTVHGTLTEAVRQISGEEVEIQGASRTDAGAHARGQVCHFDAAVNVPPERWAHALNRLLPFDLSVLRSQEVDPRFNARFGARDRYYRYRILEGVRDPQKSRFVHNHGQPLDLPRMQEAAKAFLGDHDFLAFTEELDPRVKNTRRVMNEFIVRRVRDEVWVDVVGTAFLRGMMRRMSGVLLEIGAGRRPVEEVSRLLDPEQRHSLHWPVVLPARGLCLMRVRYYGRRFPDHRRRTWERALDPQLASTEQVLNDNER